MAGDLDIRSGAFSHIRKQSLEGRCRFRRQFHGAFPEIQNVIFRRRRQMLNQSAKLFLDLGGCDRIRFMNGVARDMNFRVMAIDDVMGPALTIQKGDRAGGRAV